MSTPTHAGQEHQAKTSFSEGPDFLSKNASTLQLSAAPPDAPQQRGIQAAANTSPQVRQLKSYQEGANQSPQVQATRQLQSQASGGSMRSAMPPSQTAPIQAKLSIWGKQYGKPQMKDALLALEQLVKFSYITHPQYERLRGEKGQLTIKAQLEAAAASSAEYSFDHDDAVPAFASIINGKRTDFEWKDYAAQHFVTGILEAVGDFKKPDAAGESYREDILVMGNWGGYLEAHTIAEAFGITSAIYAPQEDDPDTLQKLCDIGNGTQVPLALAWVNNNHYVAVRADNLPAQTPINIAHDPPGTGDCLYEAISMVTGAYDIMREDNFGEKLKELSGTTSEYREHLIKDMRKVAHDHMDEGLANIAGMEAYGEERGGGKIDLKQEQSSMENGLIAEAFYQLYPPTFWKIEGSKIKSKNDSTQSQNVKNAVAEAAKGIGLKSNDGLVEMILADKSYSDFTPKKASTKSSTSSEWTEIGLNIFAKIDETADPIKNLSSKTLQLFKDAMSNGVIPEKGTGASGVKWQHNPPQIKVRRTKLTAVGEESDLRVSGTKVQKKERWEITFNDVTNGH